MSDCDLPDAFEEVRPKARKPHVCYECGRTIPVGTVYVQFSGIWNGTPGRYRWCVQCDAVRVAVFSAGDIDGLEFGALAEWANELGFFGEPSDERDARDGNKSLSDLLREYGDALLSEVKA